jgi:hypothetical protein
MKDENYQTILRSSAIAVIVFKLRTNCLFKEFCGDRGRTVKDIRHPSSAET